MLKLERESERDRGGLYQLGYRRTWSAGEDSNLHWSAWSVSASASALDLLARPVAPTGSLGVTRRGSRIRRRPRAGRRPPCRWPPHGRTSPPAAASRLVRGGR